MQIDTTYMHQAAAQENYLAEISQSPQSSGTELPFDLPDISNSSLWVILIVILALILIAVVVKKFVGVGELPDAAQAQDGLGNDSIFGHNWEQEINAALTAQNYGEAAVLCYLRWLAWLNQNSIVTYHRSKTPGIYLSEAQQCPEPDATAPEQMQKAYIIDKTATLTNSYLRVRYGHKVITEEEARNLAAL